MDRPMDRFIVVMGVSGCGKTTIAEGLAKALGGTYLEGDSFHTGEAKTKMGEGIPLTDDERWPWFDRMVSAARTEIDHRRTPVLACSALKQAYRDYLLGDFVAPYLIYLEGSFELIKGRMDARNHEYMTSDLLKSQFDTLEEPKAGERVLVLSIEERPEAIIKAALEWLK